MPTDIYRPELWHDFFVMVGGAAAALTGLVFVAMSLNLDMITRDATHRFRAIGTLAGFMAAFMICALVLMGGQDHIAVGAEWLVVASIALVIYVYGYVQAIRKSGSAVGLGGVRLFGGTAIYVAEVVGAGAFILGYLAGLYVAAVAMIVLLAWGISGAWLLVVGVQQYKARQ
jgi:hypothetical protein